MKPEDFFDSSPGRVVRTNKGYWTFIPDPLPPAITWSTLLITSLAEAERNLGRLESIATTLPLPGIMINPFIRREAVLSSRIEGTRATLTDLYHYESAQLSFLEDVPDVKEVQNYVRAMDYGLQRSKEFPVSLRMMRELHGVLMEGVRGGILKPGEFRRSQNWIGPPGSTIESATMVPPPVDEMQQALDALEKFIHAPSDLPALIRAGLIHYQFESIHPFLDGNGRLGRLLVVFVLLDWGLISKPLLNLSAFFEHHRQDYYDRLLKVSQRGDWENWLQFFLQGVSTQSLDMIKRLELLRQLHQAYRERLQTQRASRRLLEAMDIIFQRPILNIRQLQEALEVPYLTAQRYVEKLEQVGVLREVTGQARNRLYRADEIIKMLEVA